MDEFESKKMALLWVAHVDGVGVFPNKVPSGLYQMILEVVGWVVMAPVLALGQPFYTISLLIRTMESDTSNQSARTMAYLAGLKDFSPAANARSKLMIT
jgi:hypothetical protein